MKIIGIVLIVLGLVALVYQGINYTVNRKVIDIGPIEISKEEKRTIAIPPILGGSLIVVGGVLLVVGIKKRKA